MTAIRWRIETDDRIGMALDILKVLSGRGLNILSMEVAPRLMHVKFERVEPARANGVRDELLKSPDVRDVRDIEALPQEERERTMAAVLESVSEGILAIDRRGIITTINPVAERILRTTAAEARGMKLDRVLAPGLPMMEALKTGLSYNNREIILTTDRGTSHYLTTGRPIRDERGRITGVVAALKDMEEVRDLVHSLTHAAEITFDDIIHASKSLAGVIQLAKIVSKGESTVLIRGESGTGKELFARSVHVAGPRRGKAFVPINCAALPNDLLESELFGYEEGAFTGARRGGKQGLFEFASGGTVFLDEIGELSPHLQAKLLRVLQEGKLRRVGGREEIAVDVRIIAATNRDLEEMVRTREFRQDLYYRLNVIPLHIPPLRDRKGDIPVLIQHFLRKFNARLGKQVKGIAPLTMVRLLEYSWPGNVRELENVMERVVNLAGGDEILPEHLLLDQAGDPERRAAGDFAYLGPGNPASNVAGAFGAEPSLQAAIDRVEKEILTAALLKHRSSRRAGQALGVSHTTILNKVKRHGLESLVER